MTQNLNEFPALQLRDRASFADADLITDSSLTLFVVGVEFLRTLDDFLKFRVWHTGRVFDHNGLIHGSGGDETDTHFLVFLGLFAH